MCVLGCSETIPTADDETVTRRIYLVACLNTCTVVAGIVQRGRTYTSLARKRLN